MATIKLVPSTYYLSNSSYLSVSNANNMYDDTDSTNYATVTNNRSSTSSYYIYVRGFNFDDIPSNAIINSFTIKLKGNYSGGYSQNMYLYDGTNTQMGSASSLSTSVNTRTFTPTATWEEIVAAGSGFGIRINCRRSSRNTTSYIYIYGAEIEVDYTIPVSATVTATLNGNGTIDPGGTSSTYEDAEFTLTITPTDKTDTVTLTKDGVDVSSELVAHGSESSASFTADSHATNVIQSGSSYAAYCIGHTAENPYNSSQNMYASSGSTGYAEYSFDFSSIPSNAVIENIEVRCHGHRENNTIDSTHVAQCVLYLNGSAVSDEVDFQSTSSAIITVEPNRTIDRADLDDLTLRFYVGYYGGLVTGITFAVAYSTGTGIDHYTYTFVITGDAVLAVTIGSAAANALYVKQNGTWVAVSKAYVKRNGAWVVETDISSIFNTGVNYVKGN